MNMQTITLELLRHGPDHNQLLSPLVPYLALCGSHPPETVNVGFEHARFLRRLRDLQYKQNADIARDGLAEAEGDMIRFFESIRGLSEELSSAARGQHQAVHLRLILSSSELSLLPFELAAAPSGYLSRKTAAPITITRESRRVASTTVRWPEKPRILLIAAQPAGVPPVPLRAHVLALRHALDPWLSTNDPAQFARHVTVLSRASAAAIEDEVGRAIGEDRRPYTHIHVLAHGALVDSSSDQERYGLALHLDGNADKVDILTGARLAEALWCHPSRLGSGQSATPIVVTIASCDSGNQGSVMVPGASLAHHLHKAGIPLVIGSQFPLSVRGSVLMTKHIYRRLLHGDDPRVVVWELRKKLYVALKHHHDWASIVAYAALPADIDQQIRMARLQRARRALNTAIARRDNETNLSVSPGRAQRAEPAPPAPPAPPLKPAPSKRAPPPKLTDAPADVVFMRASGDLPPFIPAQASLVQPLQGRGEPPAPNDAAPARDGFEALKRAIARLEAALPDDSSPPADRVTAHGVLASAKKRIAEVFCPAKQWRDQLPIDARRHLEAARFHYKKVFDLDARQSWGAVQYLSLGAVLDPRVMSAEPCESTYRFENWWGTAYTMSHDVVEQAPSPKLVVWARAALIELYVLAQLLRADHWAHKICEKRAQAQMDSFLTLLDDAQSDDVWFDAYSLRRQLNRYVEWWREEPKIVWLPEKLTARLEERNVPLRMAGSNDGA
jgi:hypothetical protein